MFTTKVFHTSFGINKLNKFIVINFYHRQNTPYTYSEIKELVVGWLLYIKTTFYKAQKSF